MTEELQLGPEFGDAERGRLESWAQRFTKGGKDAVSGRDPIRDLLERESAVDEKGVTPRQTAPTVDLLLSESAAGRTANDTERLRVFQRLEATRAAAQGRGQTARRGRLRQG